jgi:hypothetical protein
MEKKRTDIETRPAAEQSDERAAGWPELAHTRHATEGGAPVITCYVFEKAAVCLENRGDNR